MHHNVLLYNNNSSEGHFNINQYVSNSVVGFSVMNKRNEIHMSINPSCGKNIIMCK